MTEMQLRSCAEQLNVSRVTCLPAARRGETAGSYVAAFRHSALDVGIQVLYSFHGRSKHHADTRNPVKICGRRVDERQSCYMDQFWVTPRHRPSCLVLHPVGPINGNPGTEKGHVPVSYAGELDWRTRPGTWLRELGQRAR